MMMMISGGGSCWDGWCDDNPCSSSTSRTECVINNLGRSYWRWCFLLIGTRSSFIPCAVDRVYWQYHRSCKISIYYGDITSTSRVRDGDGIYAGDSSVIVIVLSFPTRKLSRMRLLLLLDHRIMMLLLFHWGRWWSWSFSTFPWWWQHITNHFFIFSSVSHPSPNIFT